MTSLDRRLQKLEGTGAKQDGPNIIWLKGVTGAVDGTPIEGEVHVAIIPGHGQLGREDGETEPEFILRVHAKFPGLGISPQLSNEQLQATLDTAMTAIDSYPPEEVEAAKKANEGSAPN
jgi:hypothetical protein